MDHYVVTIQRQFGSMGRPIAKQMAQILGINFYDRDIVEAAAKKLDLPVDVVKKEEEKATPRLASQDFLRMCFPLDDGTSSTQDDIFIAQKRVIEEIVKKEDCIIVGRCSDFILHDDPNAIHIFIYAPFQARVYHCTHDLGLTEKEAKHMIREVDKARRSYHMRYAGYAPGDPRFKQLLIDSSLFGVEGTAQYLAEGVRRKFGTLNQETETK
ncbi:MAG TPA: cytidylate kinase-like family protein [Lachnospiraceae bacterium]|jgi:cytidylate kinase|nr:cytidylate kinase-like family protein [Lachnospiraceae bacterium]